MELDSYKIFRKTGKGSYENAFKVDYKLASNETSVSWRKISRTKFIGQYGEPCTFHLRMFEIEPGGYSSFEKHEHIHAVICESGKGQVLLDKEWLCLLPGDVLYIGSKTPHQLRCKEDYDESFCFFCIVDAVRDKPELLNRSAKFDL